MLKVKVNEIEMYYEVHGENSNINDNGVRNDEKK